MIRNGHTRNCGLARHHAQKKTAVALSAGLAEKAGVLCREHPARESGGQPVFGPITVEPATSHTGEEVFPAAIVRDGTEHATNASQAARHSPRWQPFEKVGLPAVLMQGCVPEGEYPALPETGAEALHGEEREE